MKKWRATRCKKDVLYEATQASRAGIKSALKHLGFKVPKNFWGFGCHIAYKKSRLYRFRLVDIDGKKCCVVDESCLKRDFDRWANSTEDVYSFEDFVLKFSK